MGSLKSVGKVIVWTTGIAFILFCLFVASFYAFPKFYAEQTWSFHLAFASTARLCKDTSYSNTKSALEYLYSIDNENTSRDFTLVLIHY